MPARRKLTPKAMQPTPDEIVAAHPLRTAIDRAREVIRAAVPEAVESVKWSSPSFATSEHFATFFLRGRNGFQVVLHLGAKSRTDGPGPAGIDDPAALLEWRSDDRAIVTFHDEADVIARAGAFTDILRRWVTFV